jgi:glycosyltransferase involved in cell wall biosynthesis
MNVLLAVPWDDTRGGVVSVVHNLAAQLQADGHTVSFFHPGGTRLTAGRTKLGFNGIRLRLMLPFGSGLRGVARTLAFPFLFVTSLLQLLWFLRSNRIHIVNLHYPHDAYLYFAVCRRLLRVRLVTSVHGSDVFPYQAHPVHYSPAFRFVIDSSDLVVLPSAAYERKFTDVFPHLRDRTTAIHNGVIVTQFSRSQGASPAPGMSRYVLCVAELRDYKAVDVLLYAARPLLLADPSLTLVLAGDGPLRGVLEALAASLGIRRQTMFLGHQGLEELNRLLHGCEVMVLPSRMDAFGVALIEAMACGKPVIGSAVGGIPEVIEHERTGLLVPPDDPPALTAAMQRMLDDPELRTTMGRKGYDRVTQRFSATHNGAAYISAFHSLLQASSTGMSPTAANSPRTARGL